MSRFGFVLGSSLFVVAPLLAGACSNTADDCHATSTCPSGTSGSAGSSSGAAGKSGGSDSGGSGSQGGSSGSSGSSGDAGAGGGGDCDATKAPGDEGCLVSNDYAIFVAPNGDDDNDGTQQSPFASIKKAAEVAGSKLVLVCSGNYDEHVSIAAGVRIYGGFKCADWSTDAEKPLVSPTTTGAALTIDGVQDEVLIESVSFEVGDAKDAGETALTALVNNSPKVTLRRVSLTAGEGATGANGSLSEFAFPEQSTLDGNAESPATMGGASKKCECQPSLSSTGGLGGTPVDGGQAGSKGQPDHGAGGAGSPGSCGSGGTGQDGQDAPAADAAPGANAYGSTASTGWTPASGTDGSTGQPGQGGGGGASRNASGHGGGGGCGGCGGNGGTAGKGGGGSIALLALNSPVTLEASELTTADAGNGGSGAPGQAGQTEVGNGGNSIASTNSCGGGSGGKGGAGGAGGGGAGGISVGIVWKGTEAPTVDSDSTITNGKAGAKGVGGDAGNNDGIPGVAQKLLQLN